MTVVPLLMALAIAGSSLVDARPAKMERMVVSKMRMADLETSASGYAYNQQQGLPASYVRYTNHGSRLYYDAPKPLQYVSSVAAPVAHPIAAAVQQRQLANIAYPNLDLPRYPHYVTPVLLPRKDLPLGNAIAPYYEKSVVEGGEGDASHDRHFDEDEVRARDEEEDLRDESDDFEEDSNERAPHATLLPHAGHDAAYINGGGEIYDVEKYSAQGGKGETGYKDRHEFDKGEKGEYSKDNHRGYYNDEGGQEKDHSETEEHYEERGEEGKGAKGENYGQSEYHKKGYKTTGFHNVYHKDEYKKDTDFYDEEHKGGHYEKYGSNDERHREADGFAEKGDSHDSSYRRRHHGKEGSVDKGREVEQQRGYKSKSGDEEYRKEQADYSKSGGRSYAREHGYGTGHRD